MSIEGATFNNQGTLATLQQRDQNELFSVTVAAKLTVKGTSAEN